MVTWLNLKMIVSFPVVFILFFIVPFLFPAMSFSWLGNEIQIDFLAFPREWLINKVVLPILPLGIDQEFAKWWMETNYLGEIISHFVIALNLYVPFAFVQFFIQEAYMRMNNWYFLKSLGALDGAIKKSKKT